MDYFVGFDMVVMIFVVYHGQILMKCFVVSLYHVAFYFIVLIFFFASYLDNM